MYLPQLIRIGGGDKFFSLASLANSLFSTPIMEFVAPPLAMPPPLNCDKSRIWPKMQPLVFDITEGTNRRDRPLQRLYWGLMKVRYTRTEYCQQKTDGHGKTSRSDTKISGLMVERRNELNEQSDTVSQRHRINMFDTSEEVIKWNTKSTENARKHTGMPAVIYALHSFVKLTTQRFIARTKLSNTSGDLPQFRLRWQQGQCKYPKYQ